MIDVKLLALVANLRKAVAAAKLNNARPSELLRLREDFTKDFENILLTETLAAITPEQKIAAFDALARAQIAELREEITQRATDDYSDDGDNIQYAWEDVRKAVFGKNIFDVTNTLEKIFSEKFLR